MNETIKSKWAFFPYLIVYVLAVIVTVFTTAILDGNGPIRDKFLIGVSIIYWARFIIAKARNEENKDYKYYYFLMFGQIIVTYI